jgi:hypothetical protein
MDPFVPENPLDPCFASDFYPMPFLATCGAWLTLLADADIDSLRTMFVHDIRVRLQRSKTTLVSS